jgi:anthranilate synthase component I
MDDCHRFNLIPVFREMRADFETAVSIFMKVKGKILLESVEQGENVGRFSIIALGKRVLIRLEGQKITISEYNGHGDSLNAVEEDILKNPLEKVRQYFQQFNVPEYPGLPPFFGGALGYLGYETLQYFEEIPVNTSPEYDDIPDGLMIIPEVTVIYDSVKRSVFIAALTMPTSNGNPETCYHDAVTRIEEICNQLAEPVTFTKTDARENQTEKTYTVRHRMEKNVFMDAVNSCKNFINDGEIIQVVFSQKFSMETDASPFQLYRTLRVLNPSPYLFFLDFDDFCLIGSSPEVMVRVQDGEILLKPIAGTRHRGQTVAEDSSIAKELLADPKERAEHLMLVDLGRNDLGRVSVPGSVRVTDYMKIEKYSHVMHMVSTIKGELDNQHDVFDVVRACFPAGTLSGAPKVRAMEIIAQLETEKRGPYGGMIFNLGFNGNLDSAITIRTIVLKGRTAFIQAGAGIVADSVPEKEYQETVNKARALMVTVQRTQ